MLDVLSDRNGRSGSLTSNRTWFSVRRPGHHLMSTVICLLADYWLMQSYVSFHMGKIERFGRLDVRRQEELAPGARKQSNGCLIHGQLSEYRLLLCEHTPKRATLRTTAALSGDVRVSYVEEMKPLGARRPARSTWILLGCMMFECM